ncbi:MAG TPA: substrate-binding domain-containing protein [Gemmatimonadota bacterium]
MADRRLLAILPLLLACGREAPPLRLATTTSVRDSGLMDALLPAFRERTGIVVGYQAVGTGLALRLGERGEVDALITHDEARERDFVAAGQALGRQPFAASDFLVAGPADDPADIRGAGAVEAFRRIAESRSAFASRGDSSGTHARELLLWEAAGVPRPRDEAYVAVRAGMATTLQFADQRDAYTLTDRATFLANRRRLRLQPLVTDDPLLENVYSVLVVNPARHPGADAERAGVFADWLLSDEARRIVLGLRRDGEPLFRIPSEAAGRPAPEQRPRPARAGRGERDARRTGRVPGAGRPRPARASATVATVPTWRTAEVQAAAFVEPLGGHVARDVLARRGSERTPCAGRAIR